MIKVRYLIACLTVLLLLIAPAVHASDKEVFGACSATGANNSPVCSSQGTTENPIVHVINVAASIIATIVGIAAVIMIILGGLQYITAGGGAPGQRAGDPNAVAKAKRQILYSVVALVIVALAWAITIFVTSNVIH